jgi:mono/diheme cytochrome c family protein
MTIQQFCRKGAYPAVEVVLKGFQNWGIGVFPATPILAVAFFISLGFALPIFGASEKEPARSNPSVDIPSEYQDKQMPKGWRTDPKVLAAGEAIYEGSANPDVNCAGCHGIDGKPSRKGKGAPDLSDPQEVQKSDALWFWEISEGKRRTKMRGHVKHLTEEQRWQVIAYMRTFAQ